MLPGIVLSLCLLAQPVGEPDAASDPAEALEPCLHAPTPFDLAFEAPLVEPAGGDPFFRIACQFYVIRKSDGTGGIDEALLPLLMRDLNYGHRDMPFKWVMLPEVRHIDSDEHYEDIDDQAEAIEITETYYEEGVVNWYVTPLYFGGLGVAAVWRGPPFTPGQRAIFFSYPATGTPRNIATPPHEGGHLLNLLHPYETAIAVECTDGSNCFASGDLVCDTPASPIVHGGNTKATGEFYSVIEGPCDDDPIYAPNTRLYMEAGWDGGHILKDQFSDGQLARMLGMLFNFYPDLIGDQAPDMFTDCDGNGVDDVDDIMAGNVSDLNQDLVPDSCQVFPLPGDLLVSGMTSDVHNRPRYFDGETGEYRGEIWNGLTWTHQLRLGPDGLVYMPTTRFVTRLDLSTGRSSGNAADTVLELSGVIVDILFDENDDLLILENNFSRIMRYSRSTGEYLGLFVDLTEIGMTSPKYMEYGPDGNICVVGNGGLGNSVQKFDGLTGEHLGALVQPGFLGAGQGLTFHEGKLYVSDLGIHGVRVYDAETGASEGIFVSPGDGGLLNPHSLRFGPDGHLYVASRNTHSVKRYDGETGDYIDDFVEAQAGGTPGTGGLNLPAGLLFVPNPCTADCNGDGGLDILDFVCFQQKFLDGDPAADCNGDGAFSILDFVCYQDAFTQGCPK